MIGSISRVLGMCLAVGAFQAMAFAQQEPGDEAMKRWMEFMTPGEGHNQLKFKEGKWKAQVKMWMAPGAPPEENMAESEAKLILGGRYLHDQLKGTFNGMPFEAIGTTAFDNHRKKFIFTWIDNMGTGIMIGEGDYDAAKKTWNYTAQSTDPMSGKTVTTRGVERIIDNDSWLMESYAAGPDGKEFKTLEVTYQRKK